MVRSDGSTKLIAQIGFSAAGIAGVSEIRGDGYMITMRIGEALVGFE